MVRNTALLIFLSGLVCTNYCLGKQGAYSSQYSQKKFFVLFFRVVCEKIIKLWEKHERKH